MTYEYKALISMGEDTTCYVDILSEPSLEELKLQIQQRVPTIGLFKLRTNGVDSVPIESREDFVNFFRGCDDDQLPELVVSITTLQNDESEVISLSTEYDGCTSIDDINEDSEDEDSAYDFCSNSVSSEKEGESELGEVEVEGEPDPFGVTLIYENNHISTLIGIFYGKQSIDNLSLQIATPRDIGCDSWVTIDNGVIKIFDMEFAQTKASELAEAMISYKRFDAAVDTLTCAMQLQPTSKIICKLASVLRQAGRQSESVNTLSLVMNDDDKIQLCLCPSLKGIVNDAVFQTMVSDNLFESADEEETLFAYQYPKWKFLRSMGLPSSSASSLLSETPDDVQACLASHWSDRIRDT
eukprot:TRINITY_DN4602_c0_g1_i2.p1 TRINITY_DN4602_c0_g1~~TRINITY_DN4602_c0_g1_i2.p1  ORF type:complete len:355 (+),score=73.92 TRINITY_DN4602_c0_g1_i2:63-1127(+)